jgi:hypothetical protein
VKSITNNITTNLPVSVIESSKTAREENKERSLT